MLHRLPPSHPKSITRRLLLRHNSRTVGGPQTAFDSFSGRRAFRRTPAPLFRWLHVSAIRTYVPVNSSRRKARLSVNLT
jgi:hypothetical protein